MPTREIRIIVTGGAGFIGSHVVRALAAQGRSVAVVGNLSSGRTENIVTTVPFYKVDIRDKAALTAAFQEFMPTHVIHLAGDLSSRIGHGDPTNLLETNVLGSINVVDACRRIGAEKFIFASTAGVYGEVADGTEALESDRFDPQSAYAASKASFELFLSALCQSKCAHSESKSAPVNSKSAPGNLNAIQSVVLRLANVYGPRQPASSDGGVVSIFTEKLLRRQPITLYSAKVEGDGGCQRNFVFIDDVVAAMLRALDGDMEGTFNVATSEVHRTEELLQVISQAVGVAAEIRIMPPRANEIKRSALDCSRLMSFGWRPQVSLRDGVDKTVAYIRNQVRESSDHRGRDLSDNQVQDLSDYQMTVFDDKVLQGQIE